MEEEKLHITKTVIKHYKESVRLVLRTESQVINSLNTGSLQLSVKK